MKNFKKGTLFVVSAPSGGGKGTILKRVFNDDDKVFYSVSSTTRAPRDEDTPGVTYDFITNEQFEKMIADNAFLEYAGYCDNYYGTPSAPVFENLNAGKDVVLEIETQGAFNVKKVFPEAALIFLMPPSLKELRRRLEKRGTETKESIEKRMEQAKREISLAEKYDYIVINDGLEKAVADFSAVCEAARLRCHADELVKEVLENA